MMKGQSQTLATHGNRFFSRGLRGECRKKSSTTTPGGVKSDVPKGRGDKKNSSTYYGNNLRIFATFEQFFSTTLSKRPDFLPQRREKNPKFSLKVVNFGLRIRGGFLPAAKPTGHGMVRVVVVVGGTTLRS